MKKICFALLSLACPLLWQPLVDAQTSQTPADGVSLLDDTHPEAVRKLVKQAVDTRDLNRIFTAMHNRDVALQFDCLEELTRLDKAAQAEVLSRLLCDETFFPSVEIVLPDGGRMRGNKENLQRSIEEKSYQVLNQQPPAPHGLLKRAEATALAAKLSLVR